jgi:hypothetical protein
VPAPTIARRRRRRSAPAPSPQGARPGVPPLLVVGRRPQSAAPPLPAPGTRVRRCPAAVMIGDRVARARAVSRRGAMRAIGCCWSSASASAAKQRRRTRERCSQCCSLDEPQDSGRGSGWPFEALPPPSRRATRRGDRAPPPSGLASAASHALRSVLHLDRRETSQATVAAHFCRKLRRGVQDLLPAGHGAVPTRDPRGVTRSRIDSGAGAVAMYGRHVHRVR